MIVQIDYFLNKKRKALIINLGKIAMEKRVTELNLLWLASLLILDK